MREPAPDNGMRRDISGSEDLSSLAMPTYRLSAEMEKGASKERHQEEGKWEGAVTWASFSC